MICATPTPDYVHSGAQLAVVQISARRRPREEEGCRMRRSGCSSSRRARRTAGGGGRARGVQAPSRCEGPCVNRLDRGGGAPAARPHRVRGWAPSEIDAQTCRGAGPEQDGPPRQVRSGRPPQIFLYWPICASTSSMTSSLMVKRISFLRYCLYRKNATATMATVTSSQAISVPKLIPFDLIASGT